MGFAGLQSFPTVGLIDGNFRQRHLEETGMGFALEVEMIAASHELDLLPPALCLRRRAGAQHGQGRGRTSLVAHMGLTAKGTIGAHTAMSLDAAVSRVQSICDFGSQIDARSDVIVLCHGGLIAEPDDVRYVLDRTQAVAGFFGASSIERLPTEQAITAQFESLRRPPGEA